MKKSLISIIDKSDVKAIPNIVGSCVKYCVKTYNGLEYLKFSNSADTFAEVLASYILKKLNQDAVEYRFVKEFNGDESDKGEFRTGTISEDYSQGCKYRVTLSSMGESVGEIDKDDAFQHIFSNVPDAMNIIDKFVAMRPLLKYTEQDRNNIEESLYKYSLIDYFFCNADRHTENLEFLVFDGKKRNDPRYLRIGPGFDFGNSFRTANSQLAFVFESPDYRKNPFQTDSELYAESIIKYFKKFLSVDELRRNDVFLLCCKLMNLNLLLNCYSVLNGAMGRFGYDNLEMCDDVSLFELIKAILPEFNAETNLNISINDIYNMNSAFSERVEAMKTMIFNDEFLLQAYEEVMKDINNNENNYLFVGDKPEMISEYNY